MIKVNRTNIAEHLFEYQLKLIDKTVLDAINTPNWKNEWFLTNEQAVKFIRYSIPLIKKTFKCSKANAQKTLEFFIVQFGLRII